MPRPPLLHRYGVRLNMHERGFGSVLVQRGPPGTTDRVAFQGDGHTTLLAAMAAFGSPNAFELVRLSLHATNSGCPGCAKVMDQRDHSLPFGAYPLHWIGSVCAYYWASGDRRTLLELSPSFLNILREQHRRVPELSSEALERRLNTSTKARIGFIGWDDRLGNGGFNHEGVRVWKALLLGTTREVWRCLRYAKARASGEGAVLGELMAMAQRLLEVLRAPTTTSISPATARTAWHASFGVHAIAHAAEAGAVEPDEIEEIVRSRFNNAAALCR